MFRQHQLLGDVALLDLEHVVAPFRSSEPDLEMARQFSLPGDAALDCRPVGRDELTGTWLRRRHDLGDLGQRHVDPTEHRDQPGRGQL